MNFLSLVNTISQEILGANSSNLACHVSSKLNRFYFGGQKIKIQGHSDYVSPILMNALSEEYFKTSLDLIASWRAIMCYKILIKTVSNVSVCYSTCVPNSAFDIYPAKKGISRFSKSYSHLNQTY